ncbi:MAG: TIGR02253 family HAD-type hydrolase [Chloroflexota bacterium]
MVKLRAVLFDYGHTLVDFATADDTLLDMYAEVRLILQSYVSREVPEASVLQEALTRRIENLVNQSSERGDLDELDIVAEFEIALAALDMRLERSVIQQIAEMEHRALVSRIAVEPETLGVLAQLKSAGLLLGIVSNAHFLPSLMREDVERLDIAKFIDRAVFSAEVGVRKPHEAIYRTVLEALDVRPDSAIFVGDRLRDDIGGAQALGMRTVLTHQFRREEVQRGGPLPDIIIDKLSELLPYVRELISQETGP